MAKRWYVYKDGVLFDIIGILMGHDTPGDAAAEYRKQHPRIKPDSIRVTDKVPEGYVLDGAPVPYTVLVRLEPSAKNMLKAPWTTRVGGYLTLERALLAIDEDKDGIRNTFGGLMAAGEIDNRTYRVWLAAWTEVTV